MIYLNDVFKRQSFIHFVCKELSGLSFKFLHSKKRIVSLYTVSALLFSIAIVTAAKAQETVSGSIVAENIMIETGFKVEFSKSNALLFQPNADGTYRLTARLTEAPNSKYCEKKEKIHRKTGEVMNTTGICIIPNWKAPIGFEHDLANDGMAFDDFWEAVNVNGDLPAIGGAESDAPDPVRAETFNISSELNGQLRETEFGVWTTCWEPNGTSSSAIAPAKRADCRAIKLELGELSISAAKAEADKAENDFEAGLR